MFPEQQQSFSWLLCLSCVPTLPFAHLEDQSVLPLKTLPTMYGVQLE